MTRYLSTAFLIAAFAFPQTASSSGCDGSIVTYGSATVDAKPDVAFVTLHVQGFGLLMEDAYRAASEKATAIANAIRKIHPEASLVEQRTVDLKQRESERWRPDRQPETPQPTAITRIRVTLPPDPELAIAVVDTGMRSGGSLIDPVSQRWVGLPAGAVVYGLEDADTPL